MKSKGCSRWGLWLGALLLIGACLLAAAVMYFQGRARALASRPLVLIHAPVNHEQVTVGEGVLVHATARQTGGLRRIELWVDDAFVAAQEAPAGSTPATLAFFGRWTPHTEGNHVVILRAVAADGGEGQASIAVEALAPSGEEAGRHTVAEGETLDSIAEAYGLTPEEVAAANPGLGPDGPAPGEELVIPGGEEPPAGDGAPPEPPLGSEPPLPEARRLSPLSDPLQAPAQILPGDPLALRVEFLSAGTSQVYEGLHCYLGAGDTPPRWYPDSDGDQSTDESFTLDDTGHWALAEHLSGDSAPIFYWPRNRDLPLDVSCVGIAGGGTEALDLGRWQGAIPPERWTGVALAEGATGPDGSFLVEFRITPVGSGPRGFPLWLDPDMTPPTNVRLDERRISLRWDYTPRPDEEPIDGFRIYLNGGLQWVEPAEARESGLPYEWFNPPCGVTYTFGVTAYRVGLPDGPESYPGVVTLEQPAEGCERQVMITFLTLETFDLGGDGRHEDRDGDVGPPYGAFFANERRLTFDGGSLAPGVDLAHGFTHNTTYDLSALSADPSWNFSGAPWLVVDIPPDGTFEFGFNIMDEDSGRCRNSDSPGCDDLICEGLSAIYEVNSTNAWMFDEQNEGALTSEDGRCRLTYRWGPAPGSPVGSGVEGGEPLPWLQLEEVVLNEDTGRLQLHIRNGGAATWPWRDLTVELQTREGESLGVYTWTNFVLEPGQRIVLEHPDMRLDLPFDACVLLDPFNEVLEAPERSGALFHQPVCPSVPDLVITDVRYLPGGGAGQVSVVVQNRGEGVLEQRAIGVQTYLPDGTPLYIGGSYPNITLGRYQTVTLNFGGVSESVRQQMAGGYRVVVNPDGRILESDMTNNAFDVPGGNNLRVTVLALYAPWDYRNNIEYTLTVNAISGRAWRRVGELRFTDPDWSVCNRDSGCSLSFYSAEAANSIYWFPISGDETLVVSLNISTGDGRVWWDVRDYLPSENWSANGWGSQRDCTDLIYHSPGLQGWTLSTRDGQNIGLTFQVCYQGP